MILITGGAGYIGSHVALELLRKNKEIVIVDNLSNSKIDVIKNLRKLTKKKVIFYKMNLESSRLSEIFKKYNIDSVIHLAGFKAVGESVKNPLKYFSNNLYSTINLLLVMNEYNVKKIVFSSSATVYGKPDELPIRENYKLSVSNPYGRTKLMIEEILRDLYVSDNTWRIAILRYFNPIGADSSYLIGEDPLDIPNNIMPLIVQNALGKIKCLKIFGNDYKTKDGTGERDYIHVSDLAKGHINALNYINKNEGIDSFNLGSGNSFTVLELIKTFEKINKVKINYEFTDRRPGDIDSCYADISYAKEKLGFTCEKTLEDMVKDSYLYAKNVRKEK